MNLLEPCSKKEPTSVIKQKELKTTEQYPREGLVHARSDDSLDETSTNGVSGLFLTTPNDTTYEH